MRRSGGRIRTSRGLAALAGLGGFLGASLDAARAEPERVAVFDFQFASGGPLPPTEEDRARLRRTSDTFRALLAESGRYEVVATQSVASEASGRDLRACGGCADAMGRRLGAAVTFVGEVQKVSNLILNMNVYLKPVGADAPEQAFSIDLRGNTDESFDRGIRSLVRNQLLERAR